MDQPGQYLVNKAPMNKALPPFQWTNFKLRYPHDVGAPGETPPLEWTPDLGRIFGGVNSRVNTGIVSETDTRALLDTWDIWPARGDCNDYAVTKRSELLRLGYPASVLLLAEVHRSVDAAKVDHMVLFVRTRTGNIVLDNLTPALLSEGTMPYTIIRVQSKTDPDVWESPT